MIENSFSFDMANGEVEIKFATPTKSAVVPQNIANIKKKLSIKKKVCIARLKLKKISSSAKII